MFSLLKKLLRRQSRVKEVHFETFAQFPIYALLQNSSPFNEWKSGSSDVPAELDDLFHHSVNLYQMYIFYLAVFRQFGSEIAERALRFQKEKLNGASPGWGDELEKLIRRIHKLANKAASSAGIVEISGEQHKVPLEYFVAIEFLLGDEDSPFCVAPEELKTKKLSDDFHGNEWKLCDCLFDGKESGPPPVRLTAR